MFKFEAKLRLTPGPTDDIDVAADTLRDFMNDIEKNLFVEALFVTKGNKTQAAELLGMNRTNFLHRMKNIHGMKLLPQSRDKLNVEA